MTCNDADAALHLLDLYTRDFASFRYSSWQGTLVNGVDIGSAPDFNT